MKTKHCKSRFSLKKSIAKCLLYICMSLIGMQVYAQRQTVTGLIYDESDTPLVGVSVIIQGSSSGTVTNLDGRFSIQAQPSDILVFTYIGMKEQSLPVGTQREMTVIMQEDATLLAETVVIGYGTAKKQDLTGSIGRVSSEAILRQPALNAAQSVQGKIAGVNVIGSSAPGSEPVVVIRGLGTALGGRNPLYVVDGFPVDNIQSISASDILTMDVLKDASSASIYGVRAANGVVLITTKNGKEGHAKIAVDSYVGIKTELNRVKMANASQYIQYYNEIQQNLINQGNTDAYLLASADKQPFDTNWYDEVLNNGFFNNNTVSISGGGKAVDYFFSYNYYNEKGILKDHGFQRTTIRNNNTYKFFENRLKFTQNLNISFSKENPKPMGAFNEAYRQSPLVPVKYSSGRYGVAYVNKTNGVMWNEDSTTGNYGNLNSIGNPMFTVANAIERAKTLTLQGGISGEFAITDYLKANSRFGATKYYYKNRQFNNKRNTYLNTEDPTRTESYFDSQKEANPTSVAWADNSLSLQDIETYRWLWEGYLAFNKDFAAHHLEAVAGLSRERTGIGSTTTITGYDVPEKKQYWSMNHASSNYVKDVNETEYTPRALASYFARVQYNFAHKYYVSGTIRRDGSSAFKESGDRWGTFPSFGLGWTISEEDFMKGVTFLDYLKIRGTWGKLGNQDVPINVSQVLSNPSNSNYNYVFGSPSGYYQGAAFGTPATGLSWEITRETSIGLDFTMFNQRLTGNIDFYNKNNSNAILYVNPLLNSAYGDKYYAHGAKVNNRGVEFALSWSDELANELKYEISFNYAYNRNKVKDVKAAYDGDTGGSLSNGQITKRLMKNRPIYGWWMYEADGVWQNQAEIDANPHVGSPQPGHLRYKDQNGDQIIDDRDKVYAGSYLPTSTYGINVRIEYKKFDFNIDTYGVAGNKVYNALKNARIDGGENISRKVFNQRWTGEGSTNTHPGADRDSYASTYYLESGSYFRINNITLGYTFNDLLLKGSKLRIYATAQNPFMFTGYTGFTPEITGTGLPNETAGIELNAYPTTRNFLFGINVQF